MKARISALLLFAAGAAALGACGFEPLYGRFGDYSIADELASVKIALIRDRSGQILRNALLDGLTPKGEPQRPAYTLIVELYEPRPQDLGIARDDTVVRYGYSSSALFRLNDGAGRLIHQSVAASSTSYEVTNSEYATVVGRNNARDRVMQEIAHDIKSQLAVYFRTRKPPSRS